MVVQAGAGEADPYSSWAPKEFDVEPAPATAAVPEGTAAHPLPSSESRPEGDDMCAPGTEAAAPPPPPPMTAESAAGTIGQEVVSDGVAAAQAPADAAAAQSGFAYDSASGAFHQD